MSIFQLPGLFLADLEKLGTIVAAALGVLYVVGQLMNREDKGRAPQRRAAPPVRRPPAAQRPIAQVGQNPRRAQDPRAEVERFLREVTARGRGQPAQQDVELLERRDAAGRRPAAPAEARPVPRTPAAQGRAAQRPPANRVAPVPEEPLEVEVVPESLGAGVRDHVRSRLGVSALGQEMRQSVHDHLDHRLGKIRHRGEPSPRSAGAQPVTPLGHPLSRLRSPAAVREAIVLSEILADPVSLRPPQ